MLTAAARASVTRSARLWSALRASVEDEQPREIDPDVVGAGRGLFEEDDGVGGASGGFQRPRETPGAVSVPVERERPPPPRTTRTLPGTGHGDGRNKGRRSAMDASE